MLTYDGRHVNEYKNDTCDTCGKDSVTVYGIGPEDEGDVLGLCEECFKEYDDNNREFAEKYANLSYADF
jgi:hypothetical protein